MSRRERERELAEAQRILDDPNQHGGVDSELYWWAVEVIDRIEGKQTSLCKAAILPGVV